MQWRTLMSRPRNRELSKATAASMCSGSENSTYAYLEGIVSTVLVNIFKGQYPFGWPVNLSQRIVTLLIVPQAWKCA